MVTEVITEYLVKYFGKQFEDVVIERMNSSKMYLVFRGSSTNAIMENFDADLYEHDDDYDPEDIDCFFEDKFNEIRAEIDVMKEGKGTNRRGQTGMLFGATFPFMCAKGSDWKLFNPVFISMHPLAIPELEDTLLHEYIHVVTTFLDKECSIAHALPNGTTYPDDDAYEEAVDKIAQSVIQMMRKDGITLPCFELTGIQP